MKVLLSCWRVNHDSCAFVVIKENPTLTKVMISPRELQRPFKLSGYGD